MSMATSSVMMMISIMEVLDLATIGNQIGGLQSSQRVLYGLVVIEGRTRIGASYLDIHFPVKCPTRTPVTLLETKTAM